MAKNTTTIRVDTDTRDKLERLAKQVEQPIATVVRVMSDATPGDLFTVAARAGSRRQETGAA